MEGLPPFLGVYIGIFIIAMLLLELSSLDAELDAQNRTMHLD